MSYTPPLSKEIARKGLINLIKIFTFSFFGVLVAVSAIWNYNNSFALISAIFGLYGSVFNLVSNSYINPRNQLIDRDNQPGITHYFNWALFINILPIILSTIFFLLDIYCNKK